MKSKKIICLLFVFSDQLEICQHLERQMFSILAKEHKCDNLLNLTSNTNALESMTMRLKSHLGTLEMQHTVIN